MSVDCMSEDDPPMCPEPKDVGSRYQHMVYHAVGMDYDNSKRHFEPSTKEPPHAEAEEFYDLLNATSQPIWSSCETHLELSLAVWMLSIKSDYNVTHACFDTFMEILTEVTTSGSLILVNYYKTKKLVPKLGLASRKIYCCVNECMLHTYGARECKFCGAERYKSCKIGDGKKNLVPSKGCITYLLFLGLRGYIHPWAQRHTWDGMLRIRKNGGDVSSFWWWRMETFQ